MKFIAAILFIAVLPAFSQSDRGELRLAVTDPEGHAARSSVQLASQANQYRSTLVTSDQGNLVAPRLPFGTYQIRIDKQGFAPWVSLVEIRSSLPISIAIQLRLPAVNQSVTVSAPASLIDPDQAGSVSQIGSEFIQTRLGSIPGRDLQDLVNSQPGWLYEGNAVLHPRGSEYQTQFVVDGIPLVDNRSPSFGPVLEADDVQSMSIFTAGIPAEYGRKMGGVVDVNTLQDSPQGLHAQAVLSGGTFDSAAAFARMQFVQGNNTISASGSGSATSHYLNPVVPQNYSNTGTVGDDSIGYARNLSSKDQVALSVRHEFARYDIPNEIVQQAQGQRQTADNLETVGTVAYSHAFSTQATGSLHGMVRDNSNDFESNPQSTPIEIFQHNAFREIYFKASDTVDRGLSEWKVGADSDNLFLHENLSYTITDPSQFDPGSSPAFSYQAHRPDLEQAAFVEDQIRLHRWTINAGLRWDHYQLLVNKQALQPRLAISHFFQSKNAVIHFSYDRVFQTPAFENILLSSSPTVASIDPSGFLRLPVKPSQGDYYEAGANKELLGHMALGANYFRRVMKNYADDSQIDNTTISFPIAFQKAILYGLEGRLDLSNWRNFSGFASYSYIVGNVWFPVTGGLFFGSDAAAAASQLTGHTPDSQDQRNTVRARIRYQVSPRFWVAGGIQFDSGLPFDFDGDPATVLAEYGQQVFNRINFARGRIYPAFQANTSAGIELYKSDRMNIHLQADGQNLNNVLNVIDFGGLFSGNAIGPSRSFSSRLALSF